jgi:hypothetical protein
VACNGFAKAKEMSNVSSVGPSSFSAMVLLVERDRVSDSGAMGCGEVRDACWNVQVVINFLKSGVLVDAIAFDR